MLKILNASQIKACDAFTIDQIPISSMDLMEKACHAFVSWFVTQFDISQNVGVICGTGNNGGDGLGIARLLKEWGFPVKVWIVRGAVKETDDFNKNLSRLRDKAEIFEIVTAADQGLFQDRQVLVDALFGSGLSRPAAGIYAQAISCMNKTMATRVAVDIPSGLRTDHHSTGAIVKADFTISFQLPKLAFLLPENNVFVGEWHLVDIGLSKNFLHDVGVDFLYLTRKGLMKKLRVRSKFDHKGDYGRALLISGSYGKMGACVLAARAALVSGLGLLTVHVPQTGYSIIQTAVPEAMATVDVDDKIFTELGPLESFDVIGIGPGIGQDARTVAAFAKLLKQERPLVIDADALNILSANRELLRHIPGGSILTPHPKEFERLVGPWSDDFDRLEKQRQLAKETSAVIILKGAHTSVASPSGKVHFNATGNPGMATGGSGDVLTGILTGLLAQRYSSEDAATIGVFLHGLAGDLAARERGLSSLIASDIIQQIPAGFRKMSS